MASRLTLLAALTATAALTLAGCAADSGTENTTASGDGAFPVTIESALGSATIEAEPQRVVTIGWGSQDAALALGVVPVGMQDMSDNTSDGSGILPWDVEPLGGAEPTLIDYSTADVPFEAIAELEPDLILAVNSGLTQEDFDKLSGVAPTVAYPGKPWLTSWEDQVTIVGQALGKTDEAQALVQRTNDLIAQAKADHPEFAGKTVAFGSGTVADSFNEYLASDSRVQLLEQLGFTIAPSVPTEGEQFAVQVSLENLPSIDSDVLVAWYLSDEVKSQLESTPLFAQIPAVQRGGYVAFTDPDMVYATSAVTVLSLPWMFDTYLPLLSSAAKGEATTT
ncbi:iron-siderophore ABC transporter substrate-binding protein [Pseudoclavibacter chungangensis]|uniref:Iron-siderophore ABC transporter substrate-binding protein n=1 Tax=Pseudoclavibacter chungangensis TaxID=587635 RepID=A0A7J5BZ79_9MICO|nr:iron-siderophore ABC transporter substrate-binding protein [Pseudoclavibacter chungangensis]KAB1659607.1 iron-siderophore ABC transporter substrate-binding protein [Pseudoclavibacter chungangensis]NYJ67430.1 iron complex transport system substrate-binding protein [Pseudoclavibacter chungangensis]